MDSYTFIFLLGWFLGLTSIIIYDYAGKVKVRGKMKSNIGKTASYIVQGYEGIINREATIMDVVFHKSLQKDIYILKSAYGNIFKLSPEEIESIY